MKKKWVNPELKLMNIEETYSMDVPSNATCRHNNWPTGVGMGPRLEHGECRSTGQANGSQENADPTHYLPRCPYFIEPNYCKLAFGGQLS